MTIAQLRQRLTPEWVVNVVGRARCRWFGVHNITCRGLKGHQYGRQGWPTRSW